MYPTPMDWSGAVVVVVRRRPSPPLAVPRQTAVSCVQSKDEVDDIRVDDNRPCRPLHSIHTPWAVRTRPWANDTIPSNHRLDDVDGQNRQKSRAVVGSAVLVIFLVVS